MLYSPDVYVSTRLWLDGSPTVFNVSGRGAEVMKSIGLPQGHAATNLPLVVVVNQVSIVFDSLSCAIGAHNIFTFIDCNNQFVQFFIM